jgi:hypothetical protein
MLVDTEGKESKERINYRAAHSKKEQQLRKMDRILAEININQRKRKKC